MPRSDNSDRLTVFVKNAPSTTLHLIVGSSERGTVFFACEHAPLLTFQTYGFVKRCPICRQENPLSVKKENE
jgi:hypothetical protein